MKLFEIFEFLCGEKYCWK